MAFSIEPGDLDDPRIVALLRAHVGRARAESDPGSAHALDVDGLRTPDIAFWAMWDGAALVGVGALKRLSAAHGEVKSMHVAEARRGEGAGGAMLRHIIAAARAQGMTRLSLETGSWDYFRPARALYRRHGFVPCPPFADYVVDRNSVYLTLDLAPAGTVETFGSMQGVTLPPIREVVPNDQAARSTSRASRGSRAMTER